MIFGTKTGNGKSKKSTKKKNGKKSAKKNAKKDVQNDKEELAVRQRRSLILFVSGALLAAIICIPGEMVWEWMHNAVRGIFSFLSLFWTVILFFLAVVTMIDREIPKLWFRTGFAMGFSVALNACIYIFTFTTVFIF